MLLALHNNLTRANVLFFVFAFMRHRPIMSFVNLVIQQQKDEKAEID